MYSFMIICAGSPLLIKNPFLRGKFVKVSMLGAVEAASKCPLQVLANMVPGQYQRTFASVASFDNNMVARRHLAEVLITFYYGWSTDLYDTNCTDFELCRD